MTTPAKKNNLLFVADELKRLIRLLKKENSDPSDILPFLKELARVEAIRAKVDVDGFGAGFEGED